MRHKLRRLSISDYSLHVHLGCTAEERTIAQEVLVSVDIDFFERLPAERTDLLEHTICYAEICQAFRQYVQGKEFQLIEKMAADFIDVLKAFCQKTEISLKLHKVTPPVENLKSGVTYCCYESFV